MAGQADLRATLRTIQEVVNSRHLHTSSSFLQDIVLVMDFVAGRAGHYGFVLTRSEQDASDGNGRFFTVSEEFAICDPDTRGETATNPCVFGLGRNIVEPDRMVARETAPLTDST